MKLKVVSWNIWGGRHFDDVVRYLKEVDADIIALQEVIVEDKTNTALRIAEQLGHEIRIDSPAFALEMPISSKWTGPVRKEEITLMYGNAILTKHDILSSKEHELSSGESRIALSAEIGVEDLAVRVFNVHLTHIHVTQNDPGRVIMHNGQADKLLTFLSKEKTIVMGDFNSLPDTYAITKMRKALRDAELGSPTPTWSVYPEGCDRCPMNGVQYKFDYIFTTNDLKTENFRVGNVQASDHLPVSAIIDI